MRKEISNVKQALRENNFKDARELIIKAQNQIKNYPQLIALEGIYYAQMGGYEEALAALAQAQETMKRDPALYYNIAVVSREAGRLVAAEEAIKKSLHFAPFNPIAQFEHAQILSARENHSEAIMTLFKCIEQHSLFFPAYVALSNYLVLDDNAELAIRLYEAAVDGAPEEQFFKDRLGELTAL